MLTAKDLKKENLKNKILVISGPTCSGKSKLAMRIAEKVDSTIINADSIQIYQELPILSSQPSKEDLDQVPHLLYSIFDYQKNSSVAIWLELAQKAISQSRNSNRLPIIVGGTGMYISKLIDGISQIPEINPETRHSSRDLYELVGREKFIQILVEQGEKTEKINTLDKQRLIRRQEVLKQTGQTIDWWQKNPAVKQSFYPKDEFVHINIDPHREKLYQDCNQRFAKMLDSGAIKEVEDFIKLKPTENDLITKTIGYQEICGLIEKRLNQNQAFQKATQKTRNYAKIQLTWFRNQFKEKLIITKSDEISNF